MNHGVRINRHHEISLKMMRVRDKEGQTPGFSHFCDERQHSEVFLGLRRFITNTYRHTQTKKIQSIEDYDYHINTTNEFIVLFWEQC